MIPGVVAVIDLGFDPVLRLGELAIRWQTIGVTAALLAALAVAAARTNPRGPLRLADLALITVAVVPGAVVGGRLVHALAFGDAYAAAPLRVLDPSVGSLSLLGAVLGGAASGAYICRLIGAPLMSWLGAAAVPMLLAIGLGKLAQLLGGSGQGLPFDGPWAVSFSGAGPWVSANPGMPSHPAQVYEGVWAFAGIAAVMRAVRATQAPAFTIALGWFLVGRLLAGFTWRDLPLVGPLNAEQLLAVLALGGLLLTASLRDPRYRSRVRPLRGLRGPTT